MNKLPLEIQNKILLFLTERERVNPLFVCKTWYSLIKKMVEKIEDIVEMKQFTEMDKIFSVAHKLKSRRNKLCIKDAFLTLCEVNNTTLIKFMIHWEVDGGSNKSYRIRKSKKEFKRKSMKNFWNWGLCGACRSGNLEIVKMIVDRGANMYGWGLNNACEYDNLEIADFLIEKGAYRCDACKNKRHKQLGIHSYRSIYY